MRQNPLFPIPRLSEAFLKNTLPRPLPELRGQSIIFRQRADDLARRPASQHTGRDIPDDDAARGDDRPFADAHPSADDGSRSHPNPASDGDGFSVFQIVKAIIPLLLNPLLSKQRVAWGGHDHARAKHYIVTDPYRANVKQHTIEIHVKILAKKDVITIFCPNRWLKEGVLPAVGEETAYQTRPFP